MNKPPVFASPRRVFLCLILALSAAGASAAEPASGSISTEMRSVSWTGGTGTTPDPVFSGCTQGDPSCDYFELTVDTGEAKTRQDATIAIVSETAIDYDMFVMDSEGAQIASGGSAGANESVLIEGLRSGLYYVAVKNWSTSPTDSYQGSAILSDSGVPLSSGETTPSGLAWGYDAEAPQVSVEVPLRVVMVGFDPNDPQDVFTAEEIFREIPDHQQVGVLNEYGGGFRSGDDSDVEVDTLVNHGRAYYRNNKPALLPIEYRWKPELIYAPAEFADALFKTMVEESTLASPAGPSQARFIESYNASRGSALRLAASGDPAQMVAPLAPQRMIDAQTVENWVAKHTGQYLPFAATNETDNVGYTVYFLNTWDADEALAHFPKGEYHNWYIERIDPDDGSFDGIDWGRVWGGRYRFMMVDLGAAPNAYEDQTWAGGDPVTGSTAYDPPLWEYRANAPRPVTAVHLADGTSQAVTPSETWDRDQLAYMLARTTNQAVNFRFFHSYLYEPRPGTGSFYLSDNVWHDANSELPFPTDLSKLYDQDVALDGLRSLTPYFEFDGDVVYEYLALPPEGEADNYVQDQAALDQAKADGDDIAGVPHVSMHTETMMDYLDANPERFLRGGNCFTTVPTISVVVPFHYAWALPVAAGIATNRNGVPWGFLQSVNDATKWDGSARDDVTDLYHINPRYSGSFTYTVVHEASHYLGLAHPHDTIGAVRDANGEPVYYDGFAWTYNSTASPTTYSHVELKYGILDQESIARGHTSYYLSWVDEALLEAGAALMEQGYASVADLPAELAGLRSSAIAMNQEAESLFAGFNFVASTFAASKAWAAAAALRDAALGLEPGTSRFEKATALGLDADVADCASAGRSVHDHSSHSHGPAADLANGANTGVFDSRGGALNWALLLLIGATGLRSAARRRRA